MITPFPHTHQPGRLHDRRYVRLALLQEQLECRAREHGYAYVTPQEAAWLVANDMWQPGHTIYRFSTFDRDRSDDAIGRSVT
jgi:hypothetical protein